MLVLTPAADSTQPGTALSPSLASLSCAARFGACSTPSVLNQAVCLTQTGGELFGATGFMPLCSGPCSAQTASTPPYGDHHRVRCHGVQTCRGNTECDPAHGRSLHTKTARRPHLTDYGAARTQGGCARGLSLARPACSVATEET